MIKHSLIFVPAQSLRRGENALTLIFKTTKHQQKHNCYFPKNVDSRASKHPTFDHLNFNDLGGVRLLTHSWYTFPFFVTNRSVWLWEVFYVEKSPCHLQRSCKCIYPTWTCQTASNFPILGTQWLTLRKPIAAIP